MNVRKLPRVCLLATLPITVAAAASCGVEQGDPGVDADAPASTTESGSAVPARAFSDLENRLLQRAESRIDFRIRAEGALTAALDGTLLLGRDDAVALSSQGTFGSDSVSLSVRVADGRMIGGNGGQRFEEPAPAGLREALVIGLTRMGLLHNLARLVSGSPPDRVDGTVRDWVQAREIAWARSDTVPDARGFTFDIWVEEQPTADATLWLDARGQPARRVQTVRFPGGEMRVREHYEVR